MIIIYIIGITVYLVLFILLEEDICFKSISLNIIWAFIWPIIVIVTYVSVRIEAIKENMEPADDREQ